MNVNTTEGVAQPQLLERTDPEEFDLVILGGGTGSTVAAWTLAGGGKGVAVNDRKYIGGSCPNIACLPCKNIIHSARVASYVRRSEEFGLPGTPRKDFAVDMTIVRGRKRTMVSALNELSLDNYKKAGAEFILGTGRFISPRCSRPNPWRKAGRRGWRVKGEGKRD